MNLIKMNFYRFFRMKLSDINQQNMPPDITPAQSHDQLSDMGGYMACHHNQVANHSTYSSALNIAFLPWHTPSAPIGSLTNHPEDVISNDCKFQYQCIGFKFT